MKLSRMSWLAVPVLNTLFQIFLKKGALSLEGVSAGIGWLEAFASYWILAAILTEILCFFIWMNILSKLELSKAFPLSGASYVLIVASGWFAFGEPILGLQIIGSGLILLGVWLIAGATEETQDGTSTMEQASSRTGTGVGTMTLPLQQNRRRFDTSIIADHVLRRALSRIVTSGSLEVATASGRVLVFGDDSGSPVRVRFTDTRAQWAFLIDADLRLGELYMDGRFIVERGSLYEFVAMMLREAKNQKHPLVARLIDRVRTRLRILRHRNLPGRSKRNVAHHYDLDGRLYEVFLDADRQYSCAYFEYPGQSLEDAQRAKKKHLAAKLLIEPGNSILDIGCGWGGLARHLAQSAPCGNVLGITLSEEQFDYASKRGQSVAGPSMGKVGFLLQDYRSLEGRFDRIVSVGMFEHVGRSSYRTFFRKCAELLADDGVMVLHSIGCSATPGFTTPWLDRYIFPGGYIPSLSEIVPEVEAAGLIITDVEILRLHYAWTLAAWRERFAARWTEAATLYDERFCRMWEYYLSTAEAAFRYEDLVVFQIQISKRNDSLPVTRDYILDRPNLLRSRSGMTG
ncbi:class I SAM-dependent methyltransferase [Rhizobium sp. Root1220]|uniref:class I SAM-dependent methyltransferase n=1 Tax=Rhizobium sp. Root1220 TaxID=1736432 RepID=UPI000B3016C0|nr:class I SAM-dependent methyltransferase [Rhizobium sp. Root1220]